MLDTASRSWVAELTEREERRFRDAHPGSRELAERAKRSLLAGVPMHWMAKWPGGFPVFVAEAHGARFVDVDGHDTEADVDRHTEVFGEALAELPPGGT